MARNPKHGNLDVFHDFLLGLPWWVGPLVAGGVFLGLVGLHFVLAASEIDTFAGLLPIVALIAAFLVLTVWVVLTVGAMRRKVEMLASDTLDEVRCLSHQEYVALVGEALRGEGYTVVDGFGGLDFIAERQDEKLLVICRRGNKRRVGVNVVRELDSAMAAEKATAGLIVTTGDYTKAARRFAGGKPIRLMEDDALVVFLKTVGESLQACARDLVRVKKSPRHTFPPDGPPACPRCGSAMVLRTAKKGPNPGRSFYGCSDYPNCQGTRDIS